MEGLKASPALHFIAGGVSGATGAIVTSPIEFLKTRLQSTNGQQFLHQTRSVPAGTRVLRTPTVVQYFAHVHRVEGGFAAFFKGLRPLLVGIIPSKAVYFFSYTQYKSLYNSLFRVQNSDTVHLFSAVSAGMTMSTITSPIWVVKTRMQLSTSQTNSSSILHHVQRVWRRDGLRGFYRGLSASYAGSIESGFYFVFYERLKRYFVSRSGANTPSCMGYFLSASVAKLAAVLIWYPHEVVRTRLRQEHVVGKREYYNFGQTLLKVWAEEGLAGLYGGMFLHLLRAVPNTAIVFLTYEGITSVLKYNCSNLS